MTGRAGVTATDQGTWAPRLFWAAMTSYLALALVAIKGLRGSDQYWYSSEVSSILAGTAPFSNFYFVGAIWRNGGIEGTNVFTHHTGVHYLALPLASVLGPYLGWVVTGIALTLISAALVRWIVRDATGRPTLAAIAAGAYLLSPLVFWNSINMLQESYQAFAVVLLGFCLYRAAGSVTWGWLTLLAILVACTLHPIFKLVALFYVLAAPWVLGSDVPGRARALLTAGALAVVALSLTVMPGVFPTTPTHSSILVASAGLTNSAGFMEFDLAEPSMGLVVRKTLHGIKTHVRNLASSLGVFYVFFYLSLGGLLTLSVTMRRQRSRAATALLGLTLVLLAGYVGMTSLHQVQPRYALVVYPLAWVCTAVAAGRLLDGDWLALSARNKLRLVLLAGVGLLTLGSLGIDALMARRVRSQATSASHELKELRALLAKSAGPLVGVVSDETAGAGVLLGYAAGPRPYMSLLSFHMDDARTSEILSKYQPQSLIAEVGIDGVVGKLSALGWKLMPVSQNKTHVLYGISPAP